MANKARQNARITGAKLPRLPSLPTLGRPTELRNAPRVPRPRQFTQESFRPYPDPPPGWVNSVAEWVVFWYLTHEKKMKRIPQGQRPVLGQDFFYQVRISALGVFTRTPETRIDFLIPLEGGIYRRGKTVQAIAIDPYNNFTHSNGGLDHIKREVLLNQENILLIWIETAKLEAGQLHTIEDALAGSDTSVRNQSR